MERENFGIIIMRYPRLRIGKRKRENTTILFILGWTISNITYVEMRYLRHSVTFLEFAPLRGQDWAVETHCRTFGWVMFAKRGFVGLHQ